MAEPTTKTPPPLSDAKPEAAAQQQVHIEIDDSAAVTTYSNTCRVMLLPEELILDFAINMHPAGTPQQPIKIGQRVVLGYPSAKRLLGLLHAALSRHEATFGPIEIDIQKRAQAAAAVKAAT